MKSTLEMAREAGFISHEDSFYTNHRYGDCILELERFAALVRADERNSWPAEMEAMERQVNILTDALAQAKADERECIFQELIRMHENTKGAHNYFLHAVGTIRARSNT